MAELWITEIKRDENNVTFVLNNGTVIRYTISGTPHATFLELDKIGYGNGYIFDILGIHKYRFYKTLGIQTELGGDCPYCRREDLDILFKALLEWRPDGVTPEKPKAKPKESSEWDWLLD